MYVCMCKMWPSGGRSPLVSGHTEFITDPFTIFFFFCKRISDDFWVPWHQNIYVTYPMVLRELWLFEKWLSIKSIENMLKTFMNCKRLYGPHAFYAQHSCFFKFAGWGLWSVPQFWVLACFCGVALCVDNLLVGAKKWSGIMFLSILNLRRFASTNFSVDGQGKPAFLANTIPCVLVRNHWKWPYTSLSKGLCSLPSFPFVPFANAAWFRRFSEAASSISNELCVLLFWCKQKQKFIAHCCTDSVQPVLQACRCGRGNVKAVRFWPVRKCVELDCWSDVQEDSMIFAPPSSQSCFRAVKTVIWVGVCCRAKFSTRLVHCFWSKQLRWFSKSLITIPSSGYQNYMKSQAVKRDDGRQTFWGDKTNPWAGFVRQLWDWVYE